MLDILTGEVEDREPTPEEQGKDPAAVALGRRGGLKGGNREPRLSLLRNAGRLPKKRQRLDGLWRIRNVHHKRAVAMYPCASGGTYQETF